MMNEELKELLKTKGVIGSFIGNKSGQIAASEGNLTEFPTLRLAAEIRNLLINETVKNENLPTRFQYAFDNYQIIVQLLKVGYLVVISEPDSADALLRLTLNVIFPRLNKNEQALKTIATA